MKLDKETAALLQQFNTQVPETKSSEQQPADIETTRAGARAMFLALAGELPENDCRVRQIEIDGGDSHLIPARLYHPAETSEPSAASPLPVVVFLHGGGWSLGDLDSYDSLVRDLCQRSGMLFLSVDYRLAPEHKYPAGLDDAIAAVVWVHHHIAEFGGDPRRIALMGDSAGGNLATATADRLHRLTQIRLQSQYLIYPVTDVASDHSVYASRGLFGDGDFLLNRTAIDDTRDWYLGAHDSAYDPLISPIHNPDLGTLPPTTILVAGFDPLRDEGQYYAEKLRRAGVKTRYRCFDSTIHAFLSFGVLPVALEARDYLAEILREDLVRSPVAT